MELSHTARPVTPSWMASGQECFRGQIINTHGLAGQCCDILHATGPLQEGPCYTGNETGLAGGGRVGSAEACISCGVNKLYSECREHRVP